MTLALPRRQGRLGLLLLQRVLFGVKAVSFLEILTAALAKFCSTSTGALLAELGLLPLLSHLRGLDFAPPAFLLLSDGLLGTELLGMSLHAQAGTLATLFRSPSAFLLLLLLDLRF